SSEKSIKFNDTMEEVEYMLQKGMEYMAAKDNIPNTEIKKEPLKSTNLPKTQPNSPAVNESKRIITAQSETKAKVPKSSTFIKTSNKNSQQSSNRFALDMRPFPKLEIFGKHQQSAASHPRQKELSNKQHFSHIVSPVGTYMKSLVYVKQKLHQTQSRTIRTVDSPLPGSLGTKSTLPKKAYISSELKHIVDERTPVTIPGGKKIQKYLENAMMPAVLRHDGKIKIKDGVGSKTNMPPPMPKNSATKSSVSESRISSSQQNNASLADLSVMSGDVSLYTIMDAQKF
ncbi:uncharacterized protein LOC133332840, partial [Musca vetustissima]|uniref:uncharacterized protein LOC133332840 n=1 Tax=Musca vetustissima TaxID=27455 RepID=UPI002AB79039